jgi:myo-inositol 2-dehydrogenase/D-chiro-inositol 1-dehydrogenase
LAKMVHAESIGKLKMLSIREHRRPFLEKVDNWNRFSRNSGGTMVEKCCHFFDLMRFIIKSEPVRVYASGAQDVNHLDESYNGESPDILDNAYIIVDFEDGQRAMLEICMFAEGPHTQEMVMAVGDQARVVATIPRGDKWEKTGKMHPARLEVADRSSGITTVEEIVLDEKLSLAGAHFGSTYYEHLGFLDMVKTGREPDVSLRDGLISVAMGEAAEESAKTGLAINL